jgi:hypothetical protein
MLDRLKELIKKTIKFLQRLQILLGVLYIFLFKILFFMSFIFCLIIFLSNILPEFFKLLMKKIPLLIIFLENLIEFLRAISKNSLINSLIKQIQELIEWLKKLLETDEQERSKKRGKKGKFGRNFPSYLEIVSFLITGVVIFLLINSCLFENLIFFTHIIFFSFVNVYL